MGSFAVHTEILLTKKSYDAHKRLYYDEDTCQWIKKSKLTTDDEHISLSTTETAIEQLDFDIGLIPSEHEEYNDSDHDEPPPDVDFDMMEDNATHSNSELHSLT